MTVSMTGFASRKGQGAGHAWSWDIRSVNGKGLDLRLRVPDWIEGLELALRAELSRTLGRGNVNLSLKVAREEGAAEEGLQLNSTALTASLKALGEVEEAAMAAGVTLAQPTAADVLAMRGVVETGSAEMDTAPLRAAILADLPALLMDFMAMRGTEGKALARVIGGQLDRIEVLVDDARAAIVTRADETAAALRAALQRVIANAEGFEEGRVAQELAMARWGSDTVPSQSMTQVAGSPFCDRMVTAVPQ